MVSDPHEPQHGTLEDPAPATEAGTDRADRGPQHHRTIDRVTQIIEEVVYSPGLTFAELARTLDAPKSSVHGFIRGLLAQGWLHESNRRFYLGPAVYGLTMASGQIRAGHVTQEDLDGLHRDSDSTVFLGVEAGDSLIYIAESGSDPQRGFAARSNIRRDLISTAGGKALLSERSVQAREGYLRRVQPTNPELVSTFLDEIVEIQNTGIARNVLHNGSQLALASVVRNPSGTAVATAIIVGPSNQLEPREDELRALLLDRARAWSDRPSHGREAI